MPRVLVTDDYGTVEWDERVTVVDFETEHFRGQLSERLSWAVADAETHRPSDTQLPDEDRPPRPARRGRQSG